MNFILRTFFPVCLILAATSCSKKDSGDAHSPAPVNKHRARLYAARIAGVHHWKGVSHEYEPGMFNDRKVLPDTSFELRYSNDTTIRIGSVDLPFQYRESPMPYDLLSVNFYGYDKGSGWHCYLNYYNEGDSIVFEQRMLSVYGSYSRRYTSK